MTYKPHSIVISLNDLTFGIGKGFRGYNVTAVQNKMFVNITTADNVVGFCKMAFGVARDDICIGKGQFIVL